MVWLHLSFAKTGFSLTTVVATRNVASFLTEWTAEPENSSSSLKRVSTPDAHVPTGSLTTRTPPKNAIASGMKIILPKQNALKSTATEKENTNQNIKTRLLVNKMEVNGWLFTSQLEKSLELLNRNVN